MTPLVGREDDLEALRAALSDAQAGRGCFVLVTGEAGMGKTSVLNAVAAQTPPPRALRCCSARV